MEKKTIKVKGKELPCRVTMGALLRFKHLTGMEVSELKDSDVEGVLMFVYCCVASACNADGVELGMDAETFADWASCRLFTADRIRRKKKLRPECRHRGAVGYGVGVCGHECG